MSRIIINQKDLPIPVDDYINKLQFRVVNENRNIYSEWSIIDYIKQKTLYQPDHYNLPPVTNPDDVLTVLPEPADGWESGWRPITSILPNDIVYSSTNHDIPAGGSVNQVLTKASASNYDVYWDYAKGLPTGGTTGQLLVKSSSTDYQASWQTISISADPQNGNLIIGLSMFA